jgi:lipocalin
VSTPGRKSLWILSREPVMPKDRYDAIVARLEARGFAPERMNRTAQPATTAAKP